MIAPLIHQYKEVWKIKSQIEYQRILPLHIWNKKAARIGKSRSLCSKIKVLILKLPGLFLKKVVFL